MAILAQESGVPSVRPLQPPDLEACVAIVRGLPEFFTDDVPDALRAEAAKDRCWVIEDVRLVGFAVVRERSRRAVEITWAAVESDQRDRGLGSVLIEHVLNDLDDEGVELVEVKTLDDSSSYDPYVATRHFWQRRGFVKVDVIDPLPGWQPGNPAAIYVAALTATR